MVICKEGKKLDFPCSEGFTGTLEKSVKALDQAGIKIKKRKRR